MKRLISLLLLLTLCLLFTACTGESKDSVSSANNDVTSTSADSSWTSDVSDDIRPEFKEAMDSYEAFFVEYCDFMKEMKENPGNMDYLQRYAEYMKQYTDTMSKMEALGTGEMNDAEMKYYIDVTGRVSKMLVDVAE